MPDSLRPLLSLRCIAALCGLVSTSALAAITTNPMPATPGVQLKSESRLGSQTADEAALLSDDEPGTLSLTTPAATPAAPLKALPPWDEAKFPHYAALKPAIGFWTRIFGEYSENQSVIHSELLPAKIFGVLDFRGDAVTLERNAFARKRNNEETEAKQRYNTLLRQVHELRNTPEQMTPEQKRIYDLLADQPGDDRYLALVGTLRAQRGLKERTQLALQTSNKYLPVMEATFNKYQLPTQLTRLPLVESSFNVDAYSKVGAAGLWQFMPSSARIYMRLNDVVDDRRDPWASTDGAARHLADDYKMLGSWPLALTAYNHGRGGISRGLSSTNSTTLPELIERYKHKNFGFASRNFYAEFLAANDVERNWRISQSGPNKEVLMFDTVETKHYVPYETLRRLCGADDELFRKLNPAYRPEVISGRLYVPPGHIIRIPAGKAKTFEVGYEKLTSNERFSAQKALFQMHRVKKGESLSRIAKSYGVSQQAVRDANGLKKSAKLRNGQTLKIPPRVEQRPGPITVAVGESKPVQTRAQKLQAAPAVRTHKVKLGQTLSSIARRYKVSVASLREANGLGESSHIRPGMRLKVPTEG